MQESNRKAKKAWLVSVMMGLGHMRAAYALRDISGGEIVVDGAEPFCTEEETRLWRNIRRLYYFMSRAEGLPIVGKQALGVLSALEQIPSYYPKRDLSMPNFASKYLAGLIVDKGLCSTMVKLTGADVLPVVNTFYATGIAFDRVAPKKKDNYLLICDSDFNRVWVAEDPKKSDIKYLAPCTRVKNRLLLYGVPEKNIYHTGFPLPKENIGSAEKLEVLREDLFNRLVRLDPKRHFFSFHGKTAEYYLGRTPPAQQDDYFTVMFAVGGAGAQADMVERILRSLKPRIMEGKVRIILAAGIRKEIFLKFLEYITALQLNDYLNAGIQIVHDESITQYFRKFNEALRITDVLWTKPSELSFYCALGIPILMAPTVGSHEELNSKWLQDVHAGVKMAGAVDDTAEWLFDLRENGILAEAAWDGFLKGRKLGSYKIEELVATGTFSCGNSPLER